MRFGPTGEGQSTATTSTQSADAALQSLAQSLGVKFSTVTAIESGMGLSPSEMLQNGRIAALAAAQQANPGATPGQLAASALGATSDQVQAIDGTHGTAAAQAAASKGSPGFFTDIFGDLFEVVYPFFMFALAAIAMIAFVIVTIVAVAKSPAGKSAIRIGGTAALAAA